MKITKLVLSSITTIFALSLCGCGTKETEPEKPKGTPSEIALNTFVDKIEEGGFVVSTNDMSISVYSKNLVTTYYKNSQSSNVALMTLDNDETYETTLLESGLANTKFVEKKNALTLATNYLPNLWLNNEEGDEGVWEIFTKDPNNQFRYTTNSECVKKTVAFYANLDASSLDSIKNISLTLNQEDVTEAHLLSSINSTVFDISITLGNNVPFYQSCLGWINNPNRSYPDNVSKDGKWPSSFQNNINNVFYVEDIDDPIPFMDFASCATNINVVDGSVIIHDYHATKENMGAYIQVLRERGFNTVTENGESIYRKYLRSKEGTEFRCYSDIKVDFNDGFIVTAKKYYNKFTYYGLDDINSILQYGSGDLVLLEQSDSYTSLIGVNSPMEYSEAISNQIDYSFYMVIDVNYTDKEAIETYVATYIAELLEAGFALNEETNTYVFNDTNIQISFTYEFAENDSLKLAFYTEYLISR